MIFSIVAALFSLTPAQALTPKAEIFCQTKGVVSAIGSIVEVEKTDDGYKYTFTENSYAGPRVAATFKAGIEAEHDEEGCELKIVKSATGTSPFTLTKKSGSNKWSVHFPKGKSGPNFSCAVKESLRAALCGKERKVEHAAPSFCDDANADSPICKGDSLSAD